jgi:hypothetical protein
VAVVEPREIEKEHALLAPRTTMPQFCPYVLFSYYSHLCAFYPFLALYSPLIFLQQQLLESLIWAKKWGALLCLFTFWFVWRPNFARTAFLTLLSLSPSCSSFLTLCHASVLILDSFCFGSLGLGSLLIVTALLLLFVRGLISLLFLQFHCLTLYMMYALFVLHLMYA